MRTGVFYRTDELGYLSPADSATITGLRIGRDIDLRTPSEINGTPDLVPAGVIYTNINIYGTPGPIPAPSATVAPSVAIKYMQDGYRAFVTDPVQREGIRTVLLTLAHDSFPVMYHCSGGKDRTGWTSAILETIAGVAPETIVTDYLATNTYTAGLISVSRAVLLAAVPDAHPATIDALLGVQASYLQAGFDEVLATYGSVDAYLKEGLGLTQADIYVLRGKMVYYTVMPGQGGFTGNAAAGARFLQDLQNSPLSGSYTQYNYYLQSAVDAGTLGGAQTRVGGQVHADSASFLVRQPRLIDVAVKPFASGADLPEGQTRVWMAGLGGLFGTDAHDGIAGSQEYSAGSLLGATHRLSERASVSGGLGYNWGSVESSDATATNNTFLATIGGRYGFTSLASGLFLEGRVDAGWVKYRSGRDLGGGLGNASGKTNGVVYNAQALLGDAINLAPFTLTPRVGARVMGLSRSGFDETGSDLSLHVQRLDDTFASLLAEVDASLEPWSLGAWSVTPAVTLGYERMLNDPQIESTGTLYGVTVNQKSAYDSRDLVSAGLSLVAEQGAFSIKGTVDGVVGDDAQSTGLSGQLSIAYSF